MPDPRPRWSTRHRRRVGAWTAVPLLLGTAAACGGGSESAAAGGDLTFAASIEPDCLDPQMSGLDVTAVIVRGVFDSLVSMTSDGRFHPWLAQRWTVSKDAKTYTFDLRPGVKFHDGTPLDATAVKATLDHAVDPKTKSRYAASLLRSYAGARAVDADTVEVRLSQPDASFLQAISTAYLGVQSPKAIRENPAGLCVRPVGSGPFRFGSWTRNKNITLTANPGYGWGPATAAHTGPAHLSRLSIAFIPENAVRLGALTSGQADVIDDVPAMYVKNVRASGKLRLLRAEQTGAVFSVFPNTTHGPLTDERVRLALMRSIDLDRLVQSVYFGQYKRAWSLLSPSTVGYSRATERTWPHDPALSAKLLDAAGWTARDSEGYRTKAGRRLTLRWPYLPKLMRDRRDVLAQGVQAQAKQAGIHIDLVGEDGGALAKDILTGSTMDLYSTGFVRAEPDILRYFFAAAWPPAKGGGNFFHLNDPELDGWLRAATATTDPAARAGYYAKIQDRILRRGLAIPTYVPARLVGTGAHIKGLGFDANGYPLFYDARATRKGES
ncbi:ABC transporter substrate-binding protein [Actinomadura litoris]|uniref:ABC transporter substrate-binding protein n=1 Tax=Actinomadura litoris TaxID=2678616 RepID=A0A7K1L4X3_9ACTN|nr:ABC transporter substrate-binding protein [Actinomadura litoris]MUN39460.1 ABC transporter substrate-binding protein [Actinomadura litoris]